MLPLLAQGFPELEPYALDIPTWSRERPAFLVLNTALAVGGNWKRPPLDRDALWGAFYRTPYLFDRVRKLTAGLVTAGDYRFSFQTQSLFDASVKGTPHFIYTDHTSLAQTLYPDYVADHGPSNRWLVREQEIYERARLIFTMSRHVSRSLVEHYRIPPERVRRVLAGSNVASRAGGSHDHGAKTVLFVGREWERKGGPDLMQAFQKVRALHPDATLRIVGCAPTVEHDGVVTLGEVPPDRVAEEFERATVFCMPTLREPFGLVFVEALSFGVPVVASAIGAVPDVVQNGETGYLVQPHDVPGIARSLDALLSSPDTCEQFGRTGRARMEERYSWSRVVSSMVADIRQLTDTQPST